MAFTPGTDTRYFVGSQRFSPYGKSLSVDSSSTQLDTTSLEDTAETFIYGQRNATATLELMLDTEYATQSEFTTLNTWTTTETPVTIGLQGMDALDNVVLIGGNASSVTYGAEVSGLVAANVSIQANGGDDWGYVIAPEAAITADGNGAARDLTAQSTNGGVAHLHVTAFTGLTSNVITIEDSADGSTGWATIATFATVSGVTSERLAIAGTIKRYVRVVDDVTGTGSCTRVVSLARR